MIRLAAAALLVTVCLGSAGCADNLLKERPLSRTAQTSGARPTFSAVGSAKGESSVCGAYRRQLRLVQLTLLTQTGRARGEELKSKELSLNAVIADACE